MNLQNLTDAEYRALPYESFSSLKYLLDSSPETFLYHKEHPFQGNDSTLLGTAVHHILQGNSNLVTICNIDKRKKKEYEEFLKDHQDKKTSDEAIIVPASFKEKLDAIQENIDKNPRVKEVLEGCSFEVPKVTTDPSMPYKGKVDGVKEYVTLHNKMSGTIIETNLTIVEIKTSSMATDLVSFRREAYDRHYDMQAFMYANLFMDLFKRKAEVNHIFIVVNTTPPYKVSVYRSSNKFIESGWRKFEDVCNGYRKYILNGEKYEPMIEEL